MKFLQFLPLILCGCVQTTITTPGYTFKTTRFMWSGGVSSVQVSGSNAVLRGYQSDANQTIEAMAAGVARGLGKP